VGLGIGLYYKETKKTTEYWIDFSKDKASDYVMPNVEMELFYRF
jgi:hypothetical protein